MNMATASIESPASSISIDEHLSVVICSTYRVAVISPAGYVYRDVIDNQLDSRNRHRHCLRQLGYLSCIYSSRCTTTCRKYYESDLSSIMDLLSYCTLNETKQLNYSSGNPLNREPAPRELIEQYVFPVIQCGCVLTSTV